MQAKTLSPESRVELEQLRAKWLKNDAEELRYDRSRKAFRWYMADTTDFHPEQLAGYVATGEEQEQMREQLDQREELAWLGRTEDEAAVLARWNRPDDDLEVLDMIAEEGLMAWSDEILTAFRRLQLHAVAQEYFGTADYTKKDVVLEWQQSDTGRWTPAHKMNVVEWINGRVEEKGSALAGYYSCLQTLRFKMLRRKSPKAKGLPTGRVLSREAVRTLVAKAIADFEYSA